MTQRQIALLRCPKAKESKLLPVQLLGPELTIMSRVLASKSLGSACTLLITMNCLPSPSLSSCEMRLKDHDSASKAIMACHCAVLTLLYCARQVGKATLCTSLGRQNQPEWRDQESMHTSESRACYQCLAEAQMGEDAIEAEGQATTTHHMLTTRLLLSQGSQR